MNTGLMYLCKTSGKSKDPYMYKGSGVRWLNHIKKHKSYIVTCVIGRYESAEDLKKFGLYYSDLFDVVKSPNWANLTEEKGNGGFIGTGQLGKTWKISDTSKMKGPKTKTDAWFAGKKKTTGKNNYQFVGQIKTPWGIFDSKMAAMAKAVELKKAGETEVITDGSTLRKYLNYLDTMLHSEGRRTPKNWRGKTPRDLGFDILKD